MKWACIGLLGQPNAGKSTLMNDIIGEKVSIVTRKAQTTRKRIRGIYTDSQKQLVFIDPPGVIRAQKGLNQFLQREWEKSLEECDGVLALMNVDENNIERIEEIFQIAYKLNKPWIAVITKSDLCQPQRIEVLKGRLQKEKIPYTLSSYRQSEKTRKSIFKLIEPWLIESNPVYEEDFFTTQSLREIFSEFTLESCFEFLHEEVPYQLAIQVIQFKESSHILKAHLNIIVNKETHKSIVIGQSGQTLKKIRETTQKNLKNLLKTDIKIHLHVISRPRWTQNKQLMRELNYAQ